jgi:hypothetical protein
MYNQEEYVELCKTIIGCFGTLEDINIIINFLEHDELNTGLACTIQRPDDDKYIIEMPVNIISLRNHEKHGKSIRGEYSDYLRYFSISEEDNVAIFTIIFLHELGHVHKIHSLINKYNIDRRSQIKLKKIELESASLLLPHGTYSSYKNIFSSNECYANTFAYMNFPRIWNIIKNKA